MNTMFLDNERKREIDAIIDTLLIKTGMEFPKNSIGEFCRKLGINYSLMEFEYPTISGAILVEKSEDGKDDIVSIGINEKDLPSRQVFSLAHELGHYFLKHVDYGVLFRDQNFYYSDDDPRTIKEVEANYFAASLLVPFDKLQWAMDISNNRIDKVADFFGVSQAVIRNRLRGI